MSPDRRRYARTPDTIILLALATVAGAVQLPTAAYPVQVVAVVGPAASNWAVSLVVGGVLSLVGVVIRDDLYGWVLELSGRLALAAAMTAYAVVFAAHVRLETGLLVAFIAGIAASSWWRLWQLTRRLRQWWQAVRKERP